MKKQYIKEQLLKRKALISQLNNWNNDALKLANGDFKDTDFNFLSHHNEEAYKVVLNELNEISLSMLSNVKPLSMHSLFQSIAKGELIPQQSKSKLN